jgi:hypothetical protein
LACSSKLLIHDDIIAAVVFESTVVGGMGERRGEERRERRDDLILEVIDWSLQYESKDLRLQSSWTKLSTTTKQRTEMVFR